MARSKRRSADPTVSPLRRKASVQPTRVRLCQDLCMRRLASQYLSDRRLSMKTGPVRTIETIPVANQSLALRDSSSMRSTLSTRTIRWQLCPLAGLPLRSATMYQAPILADLGQALGCILLAATFPPLPRQDQSAAKATMFPFPLWLRTVSTLMLPLEVSTSRQNAHPRLNSTTGPWTRLSSRHLTTSWGTQVIISLLA